MVPRKEDGSQSAQPGEQLVTLNAAELAALELPERLIEAIQEARRIAGRSAGARQRQYIGKLMREIDLDAIRGLLEARRARAALEARRQHGIELWRTRLLAGDHGAFERLLREHPQMNRACWERTIVAAQAEQTRRPGAAGTAARRELFRMLRELFAGTAPPL